MRTPQASPRTKLSVACWPTFRPHSRSPPRVESLTSIDPRTLAKIQGLHLRARHIVEGYVAGLHRSPYHGFSIEFAEHREYAPGDDLRYLDWKVFGRSDKVYLKQYEDETNLVCYLILDISESMTYAGPAAALSKLEYAQSVAAALAWLVLRQQDAVGLATFDIRFGRWSGRRETRRIWSSSWR